MTQVNTAPHTSRLNPSDNKVALITGGAQRIGATIARHLHSNNYNIIIHYRDSEKHASQLREELETIRPQSAATINANLSDHQDCMALAANCPKIFGRLDALINNASSFYPTPLRDANENHWEGLFDCNVKAPFFLSQQLQTVLSQHKGCIINMIDIYAQKPLVNHSIYCMTKAALQMMTLSLASEMAPAIRVNGIAPGAILWPKASAADSQTNKNQKTLIEKTALKRKGDPQHIADTVYYLTDKASYTTGQILTVDGGRTLF